MSKAVPKTVRRTRALHRDEALIRNILNLIISDLVKFLYFVCVLRETESSPCRASVSQEWLVIYSYLRNGTHRF